MAEQWKFNPFTGTLDKISVEAAGDEYTDEDAQDAVGGILTDTSTIDFTYDDDTPEITADVIPGGVDHNSLDNLDTGDVHTQYLNETRHDALAADNPHSVTFTQAVTADGSTDISAAEAETLTDTSNADSLHKHDHGELDGKGDDDHTQYLNETRHDALAADNPHSVTFTQAVTADGSTDISAAEAEELTDGSTTALHKHNAEDIVTDTTNFNFFTDTDQQSLDETLDAFLFSLYPPAAALDEMDIDSSGTTGKLSFGTTDGIGGYTNVTGIGALGAVDVDESFTNSGYRAGIFTATHSDITGTLNEDAGATANYPANAFRDIGQTLSLEINGTVTNTVDLSSTDDAINQGTATSGFNVSAKTQGTDTPFYYRTGSWRIDSADGNLRNGWNYVRVFDDQGTPQSTNYVDWVRDDNTTSTSFSSEVLDNLNMTGSKTLSGVEYHTGGDADYDITIDNAYRNTYSSSVSATNHVPSNGTISDASMAAQSGDEAATITITNKTFTVSATRIIDGSISCSTTQDRTVQSDLSSGGVSISGILMDNSSASPTDTYDDFDDEDYRLPSDFDITSTSYATGGGNGPEVWDTTESLVGADGGYNDGLQVYNDRIEYPDKDWSAVTNGPGGNPDYSSASGDRVYIRYFYDASARQNFIFNFNVTTASFVSVATGPSGNNLTCEFLVPNTTQDGGATIEWKDMVTAYTDDDSIGCYSSSVGATIPTNWGVTAGTRSTATGGNAWCIKITASSSWTGRINSVTCTPQ
jgi:hypothetical protein